MRVPTRRLLLLLLPPGCLLLAWWIFGSRNGERGEAVESASYTEVARQILADEFGITRMEVRLDERETTKQCGLGSNAIDFEEAIRQAMRNLLEDPRDAESPLSIVLDPFLGDEVVDWSAPWTPEIRERARELVRDYLDHPDSGFRIVPVEWSHDYLEEWWVYPPENGEAVEENWIFYVDIPTLSDHLHWVIIDRKGKQKAFNYGFN